ncbi:MAG TPA: hypothetical protein PKL83_00425 [bacterium]|nr:hypothetical protein [bacterium]
MVEGDLEGGAGGGFDSGENLGEKAAEYVAHCLDLRQGDSLVILYDGEDGREKIAEALLACAQKIGVEVRCVNLDDYMQSEGQDFNIEALKAHILSCRPTKSYLASKCPHRAEIMRDILGCMPLEESQTGLATLHGHDPELTWEQFLMYGQIDMRKIEQRANEVVELMRAGQFYIEDELGTRLNVQLDTDRYQVIRGTGSVADMAADYYDDPNRKGNFWTNVRGGEVFTFPPVVEGTIVTPFRHAYWEDVFAEYADLDGQVQLVFQIKPNGDRTFSYIYDVAVTDAVDESLRPRVKAFVTAITRWLGIGEEPINPHAIIGEIGIGLVDGSPIGDATHDEKLRGTFHIALGGAPDTKATARARQQGQFPYEVTDKMRHLDIVCPWEVTKLFSEYAKIIRHRYDLKETDKVLIVYAGSEQFQRAYQLLQIITRAVPAVGLLDELEGDDLDAKKGSGRFSYRVEEAAKSYTKVLTVE